MTGHGGRYVIQQAHLSISTKEQHCLRPTCMQALVFRWSSTSPGNFSVGLAALQGVANGSLALSLVELRWVTRLQRVTSGRTTGARSDPFPMINSPLQASHLDHRSAC